MCLKREVLSWLFDKIVIYRLGFICKVLQLAKYQEINPVKANSRKLFMVVCCEGEGLEEAKANK